ncbi:unnamed protein product [Didymodactylos carnosus]|uniref:MOB kinase activator-like 2 n=1 Tax=Didymodactylos carnosus TaxID=1234261 RepID=A0A814FWK7_9BILA|nr:unnamed protein product [Didymodactylos carnosus]CAF3762993.1 unnamed protein product [Didymodactylos carnosus]
MSTSSNNSNTSSGTITLILTALWRKTRRKDAKESSPPIGGEDNDRSTAAASNQHNSTINSQNLLPYLRPEYAVFTRAVSESNIAELIRQPAGVDRNEWIASNTVSFFNHVNLLYGAMSDYCTQSTCPVMTGPQNSQYYWYDERSKKIKCSAPQYMDYAMMYIQRQLNDETIFPTRLDQSFPISFDVHVRKIVRYLFHCVAHLYSSHYRDCVSIHLHPHLNSLFLHFLTFLFTFHINGSNSSTTVDSVNNLTTTSNQLLQQDNNKNDLKSDIDTLDMLYQLLAHQWKGIYQQKLEENINKTPITPQSQSIKPQSLRKNPTTSSSNFLYEQQQPQTHHTTLSLPRSTSRSGDSLSNANSNVTLVSHE